MRKLIYSIAAGILILSSCQPETKLQRPFNLYQVETVTATAGDNMAEISWTTQSGKPDPDEFLVIWTPEQAGAEAGEDVVAGNMRSLTVEDLINDCGYTFSVQARYADGLSGKVTAKCTPKTSRFPVTGFIANAGSERVLLKWTKPLSDRLTSYSVSWTPGNGQVRLTDTSVEQYMVDGLVNDTEYTFTIICNYPNGDSEPETASAVPGVVSPVLSSLPKAIKNQIVRFEYNPMYFMAGEAVSASWEFGDGETATGLSVSHSFAVEGTKKVKVTVSYSDGKSESAEFEYEVVGYSWSKTALTMGGYTGFVKASSPAFSPDGSSLYISTSNGQGDVFAIDTWTGQIKWTYPIAKATYGGGPAVGPDGSIYVGAQNSTFYAIKEDGQLKWEFAACGNVEAFPAVTSDNNLYIVANGPVATLYSLNTNTGAAKWSKELAGGTGSAVAVDADGNVYVGSNGGLWSFTSDGTQRWASTELKVTERGSFAIDGNVLYAALKATDGVAAINMADGTIKWTSAKGSNDSYFPITGPDGTVYYTSKGGKKVYALNPDGSLKWETAETAALIYAGLVLTSDGKLYTGTQAVIGDSRQLLTIDAASGAVSMEPSDQIMSAFTFGPDCRVYYGTVAGNLCTIETSGPADSWSMRGGNSQGTNSLR
ncbi:MAG: PQQ-binding-like beta-propeller repeat protein [Candidatus Cryptobacteroides sp.]